MSFSTNGSSDALVLSQAKLINHIVLTYFMGAYTMCRIMNATDKAIDVLISDPPIVVVQIQNGIVEAIDVGCNVFLIEEDAALGFLDDFVTTHDAARFRCSTKHFLIVLQSTGEEQQNILERIQMHSALEDMPNILLIAPKDKAFELITNRFVGNSPESQDYILLDTYKIGNESFVYKNNLYQDKLLDLMGKRIKMASFNIIPWMIFREAEDGIINFHNQSYTMDGTDGYSVVQFCLRHNCSWDLYVDEKHLYGEIFANGTGNGMFGALLSRKVGFAIGAVGGYHSMFKYFTLSKALQWAGVTCLTAKPKLVPYWKFIFMIFSPSIWSILIMTFMIVTSCLYLANRKNPQYGDKGYVWIFLKVLKTFVLATADLQRSNVSSVILITSLLMFTLIVCNVYIGQIHSILTLPPYQASVNTVQDLIKSGLRLVAPHLAWIYSIDGSDNPNDQKLLAHFQVVTPERMSEIVNNGWEAIMIAFLENGHSMVGEAINAQNIRQYRLMKEALYYEYEVAYATKTWPLLDKFEHLTMWIRDACLFQYLEQITVNRYMDYWVQIAIEHSRETPHVQLKTMAVEEISGALMILGVGFMISISVFLLEIGNRYMGCRIIQPHRATNSEEDTEVVTLEEIFFEVEASIMVEIMATKTTTKREVVVDMRIKTATVIAVEIIFGVEITISTRVFSMPSRKTNRTPNLRVVFEECLLLPFLKKHGCSVLFLPDLASCHYGKKAMEWYAANNVQVVPKDKNPPNTPELRPIVKYWAIVKRNLKKTNKTAKDEQQFKANWLSAPKKVDKVAVQNLIAGVKPLKCFIKTSSVSRRLNQKSNMSNFSALGTIEIPDDFGVSALVNLIVLRYFKDIFCTCIITQTPEDDYLITFRPPYSAIYLDLTTVDEQTLLDSIDNGCQSFIVTTSASQTFLDEFHYFHDRALQRFSNKKVVILIDNQTIHLEINELVQHDAIHDIPNLLFVIPDDHDRIKLKTNRFITQDRYSDLILLDEYIPSLGTFLYENDLFPQKLHNMEGRYLRLAIFNYHPYTMWEELNSTGGSNADYEQQPVLNVDGTESRIFLEFCAKYNCTLDISLDEANEWGEIFDNRTGNGIIGAVVEHRADIGVGALYSWHHESIYLTLSKPISRSGITCITPMPKLLNGWLIPILPFSQNLWIAVLSTFLFMSFFSLFVNYLVDNVLHKENRRVDLCESFMIIGSIFILQTVLLRINRSKLVSQMIIIGSLLFVGLMIGNVYSGGLSSIMTIPRYERPIDTVQDLADNNFPWASTHDAWIFSILMATQPTIIKILHNFQTHPKEVLHHHTKTLDLAYSVERLPYGHFAIGEYIDEEASHKFHLMIEDIYWENCVAMSTKTWPMMEQLDQLILTIFQSGMQRYWELQVVSKFENNKVQLAIATSRHQQNSGPVKLQPSHLLGAFMLLGFGLAAGLVVCLGEVSLEKFSRKAPRRKWFGSANSSDRNSSGE
ncbi:uncharacterized protein LOC134221839 [Armigeres subalbatus]|uniref:uncharacterized protein LOC134221839 n=1 Tax=Armigeres subalbatus TaxID=124917 RepID=UPI002ED60AF4